MLKIRNYEEDSGTVKSFLKDFYKEEDDDTKVFVYSQQLIRLANREQSVLYINLDDMFQFNEELCSAIEANGYRYQRIFASVIDSLLPEYKDAETAHLDVLDLFIDQRVRMEQQHNPQINMQDILKKFPPELLRRCEVYFTGRTSEKPHTMRTVLASSVGKLIQVNGVVTRATDVKPLMKVATYTCDRCGAETYQEITNPSFMPMTACMTEVCRNERTAGGRLHLQTRGSKFIKFQELRVQEMSEQVPVGSIPRSMSVHCRGDNTRLVQPGDHVHLTGIFLPSLKQGFKATSQGLLADTFLEVHQLVPLTKNQDELESQSMDEEEKKRLQDPDFYSLMAQSLAPEIFGHEDVKRALLLLLIGGNNLAPKGMKIRGSINICLMGDPGVAKSQLLTFVDRLSPRSQYTTGRGSSGVGLTAAVVKDTVTGEMTLEGGALVLADQGVCCIDEFDKMAEFDRTAIHEVMEQQTISIAKAGILTTLNARVAILAAANPAYGRYNPRKTVEQNVDLPAALLSRFDLLWLIQDKPDRENDLRLAQHITYVHMHNSAPSQTSICASQGAEGGPQRGTTTTILSMQQLRRYLAACKAHQAPNVPATLADYLVGAYVEMRKEARNSKEMTFTSARTLLAILRLSTALARLRLRKEVTKMDIDEAMRLTEASRSSVHADYSDKPNRATSYKDYIYQVIRDMASVSTTMSLKLADIMERCASKGYKPDQVNEVVDNYESLNVWQINTARTRLTIVN